MYLFFYMALGLTDFDVGKSITFLGPNELDSLVAISGPKKVSIFQGPPLQVALEMDFPRQNHDVPRHINSR